MASLPKRLPPSNIWNQIQLQIGVLNLTVQIKVSSLITGETQSNNHLIVIRILHLPVSVKIAAV